MIKSALVVTSIAKPNAVLQSLADGSRKRGWDFIVIGDVPSPADFELPGCRFFSLAAQQGMQFTYASLAPLRHYARKNLGYLLAIADGADCIIETDDDNFPREEFFEDTQPDVTAATLEGSGWSNVYSWFADDGALWPRGLPLDQIHTPLAATHPSRSIHAPIQQGLADDNPDVDAVYRLVLPLPRVFKQREPIALGRGSWCPFNSQNTRWFAEAYPLLYLPATCTFRMTDIWRSFVAQRIAQENGWHVLFHNATVWQERNDHNLMRDFADEVPGYLHNDAIMRALAETVLQPGADSVGDNLRVCYQMLVHGGWVRPEELRLVDAWLNDIENARQGLGRISNQ